ncbi:MAG: hypothetical protein RL283_857, partial [Actinomycetota bacterium]
MTAPGTPGSTVRYVRPGAVSAGVVFASLSLTFALADVSMFSSVGASALVLLQTVWGASVWGRLTPSRSSSPWERLGMGFVIGLVGIVVAGQLRAALGVAPLIWWSAIIGAAFLDVARTRPSLRDVLPSTAELWLAWSAALVILGPQWYWTLPVGGSLYLVALAHQFSESRRLRWVTLVIALGTTVLTVVNRPTAWRPLMFEQIYLEFVGRAAVDFGGWNNPLALGRSLDYHWVSYAWMMTYSDLLGLARLESLVEVGPILIALGAVAAAAALASRIGGTRALWWALPALAFFDTPRVWS